MKRKLGNSDRTGFFALVTFLTAFATAAQDAPPPAAAPPAPPVQAPAADANQQGGRGNRGGNNNNNNVQRGNFVGGGFNMDDKQRELLQEARQVNGDDLRKLNEKLAEAQKEFVKAVVAEKYDEKVVREKADAVGKIQAEILALNGKAFATVSPTLKPEQKEILEGNARIGIALISPDRGLGGGGPGAVNFAGGGGGGGGRGNFPPGGDVGFGGGGRGGGARDAGPGQDRNLRRGGNGGPGTDGNTPRRRLDSPAQ